MRRTAVVSIRKHVWEEVVPRSEQEIVEQAGLGRPGVFGTGDAIVAFALPHNRR